MKTIYCVVYYNHWHTFVPYNKKLAYLSKLSVHVVVVACRRGLILLRRRCYRILYVISLRWVDNVVVTDNRKSVMQRRQK